MFPQVLEWAARTLAPQVVLVGDFNADGSYFAEGSEWQTLFGVPSAASPGSSPPNSTIGDAFRLVAPDHLDTTVAASANACAPSIV